MKFWVFAIQFLLKNKSKSSLANRSCFVSSIIFLHFFTCLIITDVNIFFLNYFTLLGAGCKNNQSEVFQKKDWLGKFQKVICKAFRNSYILIIGSSVKVLGNTLSLILPCSVYLPLLFKKVACKSILQTTKHRAIKELAS